MLCVEIDPPPLIVGRDNVTAVPGDVAQLMCVVQSSVEFNVTWLRVVNGATRSDHRLVTFSNGTAIIRSLITTFTRRYSVQFSSVQ